jgi:hypothetical protein
MIVKFLRPSTSFKGVGYSFAKMLLDKGELMQVKNFGVIEGLSNPRAEDYVNYLQAVTGKNKRIVNPQLHVTISTKGRDHSKQELTGIAEKWLHGMGYGQHPYLIIFHKDTQNNHVHLVSTRIGRDGKKVKDSYEKVNGYKVINQIMGLNSTEQVQKDISQALNYSFNSRAQFMMMLEVKGYTLNLKEDHYQIFKFGEKQSSVSVNEVDRRIGEYQLNKKRLQQLRAIIEKYRPDYDPALYPEKSKLPGGGEGKTTGYNSKLAAMLQRDFGLQIFFHAKDGKQPYGYSVLDHTQRAVYKGGDLMPLAEFIKPSPTPDAEVKITEAAQRLEMPEFASQEEPQRFTIDDSDAYLPSESTGEYYSPFIEYTPHGGYVPPLRIDISEDIDDEQINGRNRRRKRKARTNTR